MQLRVHTDSVRIRFRSLTADRGGIRTGFALLCIATLGTLLFNDNALFTRSTTECSRHVVSPLFCLMTGHERIARWLGALVCLLGIWGTNARYVVPLYWYVAFSVAITNHAPDGGDVVASSLALLLIPLAVVSPQTFVNSRSQPAADDLILCRLTKLAIVLQVGTIYFDAAVTKLYVDEWRDGTALYYLLTLPKFSGVAQASIGSSLLASRLVGVGTYATLAIEFLLAFGWLSVGRGRVAIFAMGLLLHLLIGLAMGLWSFSTTMFAALALYLTPIAGWDSRPGTTLG